MDRSTSTDPGPGTTEICLRPGPHGPRVTVGGGLLRASQIYGPPDRVRLALIATTALLLGGDAIDLRVTVGEGIGLELREVAGTVAYSGRGRPAGWRTSIWLQAEARLVWAGEPFVVADGADVERFLGLDLAPGATALVRETLVLGRHGEVGGRLHNRTLVRRDGREVLVEDLLLDEHRRAPGRLGQARVLDSILALEIPRSSIGGLASGPPTSAGSTAVGFDLAEPGSRIVRWLGPAAAPSPLHRVWSELSG